MRGVGQRSGIAAVSDMKNPTSQMNPNSALISVVMNNAIGSATHGGRLNLRAVHSARLLSQVMRRVRCR